MAVVVGGAGALRDAAVRRLVELSENGALSQAQVDPSAGLPRYIAAPRLANGRAANPDAPALRFEVFVDELLAWVRWWNGRHEMDVLDGRTPLQPWRDDPTPLTTVPASRCDDHE